MVEVQGHRGFAAKWPENSLEGFFQAAISGAHVLEVDLRMNSEGVVVLHHDPIKAGYSKKIPSLSELCDLLNSDPQFAHVRLNLDMKEVVVEKVVDVIERSHFANKVSYQSFHVSILEEVRALRPIAPLGFIVSRMDDVFPLIERLKLTTISPLYTLLTAELVERLHRASVRVIPWTVNQPEDWKKLLEMGVDGIITDDPKELVEFIRRLG